MEPNKVLIFHTTGPENPEKATLVFVMSTNVEVTMVLQSNSVRTAKFGKAEKIAVQGLMPKIKLLDTFIEKDDKMIICSPRIKERGISPYELLQEVQMFADRSVLDEILSSQKNLSY